MDEKQNLYIVNKVVGETPLEALERVRTEKGISPNIPMTYAGRLDPVAEGVLLVLVGGECKNKDKYLGLDKEYEVEVLFGFETDSRDILGKLTSVKEQVSSKIPSKEILKEELNKFVGKFTQEYPAYSSKAVDGVQLHTLARKGELPNEMPTKEVEIYDIQILEEREIDSETLCNEIKNKISKVKGGFRQEEILNIWRKSLKYPSNKYSIIKIKVSCSSGTYMRSLAHNLGQKLGMPALAYSIKRTEVGDCKISNI